MNILATASTVKTNLFIPGIGEFERHYDRIEIVSPIPVAVLKTKLPLRELKAAAHKVAITSYTGRSNFWKSYITLVCAQDDEPIKLLLQHQRVLGWYSVIT